MCCEREECLAENKRLKNQMIREKRKNSDYTRDMDNYTAYVRNKKKDLRIAKVSPYVMDEFDDLKEKCKSVVDSKLAEWTIVNKVDRKIKKAIQIGQEPKGY